MTNENNRYVKYVLVAVLVWTILCISLAVSLAKNVTVNVSCLAIYSSCGDDSKIESHQGDKDEGRKATSESPSSGSYSGSAAPKRKPPTAPKQRNASLEGARPQCGRKYR